MKTYPLPRGTLFVSRDECYTVPHWAPCERVPTTRAQAAAMLRELRNTDKSNAAAKERTR